MKLTCLGVGPARCLLLTLRKTNILLDCGLWGASGVLQQWHGGPGAPGEGLGMPQYLGPLLKVLQCYDIEAALFSTAEGLLALPHLLAAAPALISGPVYATTAALDVARHLVAELVAAEAAAHASRDASAEVAAGAAAHAGRDVLAAGAPAARGAAGAAAGAGAAAEGAEAAGAAAAGGRPLPQLLQYLGAECKDPVVYRSCWGGMYTGAAAEKCFEPIKAVRYGQAVPLDSYELTAHAFPSGSGMGHAAWTISDGCRSIGYLSSFRLAPGGFALELQPPTLSHLHALIVAPGCLASSDPVGNAPPVATRGSSYQLPPAATSCPPPPAACSSSGSSTHDGGGGRGSEGGGSRGGGAGSGGAQGGRPPAACHGSGGAAAPAWPPEQQLQQAVLSVASCGGSTLLPLPASGVAWDAIEAAAAALASAGLHSLPLLYISPCACDSLALADTSMEFLNAERQERAFIPEPAYTFRHLQAAGRLIVAGSVEDAVAKRPGCLDAPCVVIASSASLAGGPALQLLRRWSSHPQHTLVLSRGMVGCAPSLMADALRSAIPGLRMRITLCDWGAGADAPQLARLLGSLPQPPGQLLMSRADAAELAAASRAGAPAPPQQQQQQQQQPPLLATSQYGLMDALSVQLPKHAPQALATPGMLQGVQWRQANHDASMVVGQLAGIMLYEQGRGWQLKPPPTPGHNQPALAHSASAGLSHQAALLAACGRPTPEGLMRALQARGLASHQGELHQGPGEAAVIIVPQLDATITLHAHGASISATSESARKLLASCVMSQLQQQQQQQQPSSRGVPDPG